jgi:hypothetical protein
VTDHPAGDDRAIRDLLASYALALDTDDIDRCVDLFTDDGTLQLRPALFDDELSRDGRGWRFRRRRCRFITSGGLRPEGPSS